MGSKYQKIAKSNIQKSGDISSGRPQYYDEKIKSSKSKANFPVIFLIGIIVVGFGIFGIGKMIENATNPEIGDTNINTNYNADNGIDFTEVESDYATPLTLTDVDGNQHNLEDYQGRIVVLYIFYIDCPACSGNSPNLATAIQSYATNSIESFAISVKPSVDSVSRLKEWKSEGEYPWTLVRDTDYSIAATFQASSVPLTVFLDYDGNPTSLLGYHSVSDIQSEINQLME